MGWSRVTWIRSTIFMEWRYWKPDRLNLLNEDTKRWWYYVQDYSFKSPRSKGFTRNMSCGKFLFMVKTALTQTMMVRIQLTKVKIPNSTATWHSTPNIYFTLEYRLKGWQMEIQCGFWFCSLTISLLADLPHGPFTSFQQVCLSAVITTPNKPLEAITLVIGDRAEEWI